MYNNYLNDDYGSVSDPLFFSFEDWPISNIEPAYDQDIESAYNQDIEPAYNQDIEPAYNQDPDIEGHYNNPIEIPETISQTDTLSKIDSQKRKLEYQDLDCAPLEGPSKKKQAKQLSEEETIKIFERVLVNKEKTNCGFPNTQLFATFSSIIKDDPDFVNSVGNKLFEATLDLKNSHDIDLNSKDFEIICESIFVDFRYTTKDEQDDYFKNKGLINLEQTDMIRTLFRKRLSKMPNRHYDNKKISKIPFLITETVSQPVEHPDLDHTELEDPSKKKQAGKLSEKEIFKIFKTVLNNMDKQDTNLGLKTTPLFSLIHDNVKDDSKDLKRIGRKLLAVIWQYGINLNSHDFEIILGSTFLDFKNIDKVWQHNYFQLKGLVYPIEQTEILRGLFRTRLADIRFS